MTTTRTFQVLVASKPGKTEVQTVEATSYDDVEAQGSIIDILEVVPQDFEVGTVLPMDWVYYAAAVGGSAEGMCLKVSSITRWDRDLGERLWHHPEPVRGEREYLVTMPAKYCHHLDNGGLSWCKGAMVQVVKVIN